MSRKKKIQNYILDLYWEYQRMGKDGKITLDKLAKMFDVPTNAEQIKMMEESND